jgi:hypothetical protein
VLLAAAVQVAGIDDRQGERPRFVFTETFRQQLVVPQSERFQALAPGRDDSGFHAGVAFQLGGPMAGLGISLAAVGIGLAISALSKTTMQAVMIVPLALIPQILFSGLVVKAPEMKPPAFFVTQFSPSYAAQTIMDLSCFQGEFPTGLRAANNRPGFDHVSFLNQRSTGKRLMAGDQFFSGSRGWLAASTHVLAELATASDVPSDSHGRSHFSALHDSEDRCSDSPPSPGSFAGGVYAYTQARCELWICGVALLCRACAPRVPVMAPDDACHR